MNADEMQMYGSWSQHWATQCSKAAQPCWAPRCQWEQNKWDFQFVGNNVGFFSIIWVSLKVLSSLGETLQSRRKASAPGAAAQTSTQVHQSGISPGPLWCRAHQALSFRSALSKTQCTQHTSRQGCGKPALPLAKACKGRDFPKAFLFSWNRRRVFEPFSCWKSIFYFFKWIKLKKNSSSFDLRLSARGRGNGITPETPYNWIQ